MSLRTALLLAVVLTAGLLGAAAGLYAYGWYQGEVAGKASVQESWDAAVAAQQEDARVTREDGRAQAEQLAARVKELESRYAAATKRLNDALRQKVVCPPSGEVGDVVLPGDVVRSMFNGTEDSAAAVGPASSGVAAGLRAGPGSAK